MVTQGRLTVLLAVVTLVGILGAPAFVVASGGDHGTMKAYLSGGTRFPCAQRQESGNSGQQSATMVLLLRMN